MQGQLAPQSCSLLQKRHLGMVREKKGKKEGITVNDLMLLKTHRGRSRDS